MGTARTLVTGSAGHLGEALMRVLRGSGEDAVGLDLKRTPFTDRVGSITERRFVRECIRNVDVVLHTATLHKPHIATHTRQAFIDTNITGTLNLLEEAVAAGAKSFVSRGADLRVASTLAGDFAREWRRNRNGLAWRPSAGTTPS